MSDLKDRFFFSQKRYTKIPTLHRADVAVCGWDPPKDPYLQLNDRFSEDGQCFMVECMPADHSRGDLGNE